jgi:prolyl oligopeptidase
MGPRVIIAPLPLVLGSVIMMATTACVRSSSAPGELVVQPGDAGYLWLEDLRSDSVIRWADAHTARAREHLASGAVHDSLVAEIRSATAASRLVPQNAVQPPAIRSGPWANRFQAGVWMRQPVESFVRGDDAWERVLDLDSLSRAEEARFDIAAVECLPPAHERCLLLLSRGGGTRTFDLREYDAAAQAFVSDGFNLEPGHTAAFWSDANSVYITSRPAGSADRAVVWRRGQSLDDARVLFTMDPRDSPNRGDQGVAITRKGDRLLLQHSRRQYDVEYYLLQRDETIRLPVPRDSREILVVDGQLVLQLRSAWTPADVGFPSGSLIGIELQEFLDGSRAFKPIMTSDSDLVVDLVWSTRSLLIVRALADMKVRLFEFSRRGGEWEPRRIDVPEDGRVEVRNASSASDEYYLSHEDFLRPRTAAVRMESGEVRVGGIADPAFPAAPYQVERWRATSADGTHIPYFVVRRKDMAFDGRNPVIINGYGGNGISMLPQYLALHGPTWLSRGGVYVLANIRGGNEYGPEWHAAVLREKRQRAFDDFQAVAANLVERQVTSPKMIGAYGGSNGGILVATSFVQRPDLFGAIWANNGVLELQRCSQLSGVPPVGERGDGQNPADWDYMRRYSPFHNLAAARPYPALLFTANRADDIVHPCHSRKFTARLQDLDYRDVFFYETEEGGHGKSYSASEQAMIMTFFLRHLHPEYRPDRSGPVRLR